MQLYNANVSSKAGHNIRLLPLANASIVSKILTMPIACKISKETVEIDGYNWFEIIYKGQRGFCAKTDNLIIQYTDEAPKIQLYEVNLGFATVRMDIATQDKFATIIEGIAQHIRNAPLVE